MKGRQNEAQPRLTQERPNETDQRRRESKRDRHERNLDQHVAPTLIAGRSAHGAVEELAKARVSHGPALVMQAIGRGQQEEREEDHEEQRHDDEQIVDLWSGSESEPGYRKEPDRSGDRDLNRCSMAAS